ncbi:MAG: glycosyltransferase family 2 protein [Anaerolineae bacterium]|nr:glycosyltransferase family 2 protein [Anaerolineae bacterium]
MTGPTVSVVIPAYNEEVAIGPVLKQVVEILNGATPRYEIIVVDDGSGDNTAQVAQTCPQVKVLRLPSNRGYGAALKAGIRHAAGQIIVITDADGTYPNNRIPDLLTQMAQADMVVGARTHPNVRIPVLRRPAKWFLRKLAEYVAEAQIPDLNSGLRAFYRADALRYLPLLPNKFSFTTTITLLTLADGGIIEYLPIAYHRRVGKSKIKPADAFYFFALTVRTALLFNPLKVFLPPGAALVLLGLGMGLYQLMLTFGIAQAPIFLFLSGLQIIAMGLLADLIVSLRHRS